MRSCQYAADLFRRALARVEVAAAVRAQVSRTASHLCIGPFEYRFSDFKRILIVAAGKAALPMAGTFVDILSPSEQTAPRLEGVVVSGGDPEAPHAGFSYYAGGHPVPNQASRAAAEDILMRLRTCGHDDLVLFLISGGASALMEQPLWTDVSVEETALFYQEIVHSGLSITEMNCLRKHFSAVKGGKLAEAAAPATQCTVLISDVPEGSLDVIGSGPSMPDSSTTEDCRRILGTNRLAERLPVRVKELLTWPGLPETVKGDALALANASFFCLLSNNDLLREASSLAGADGYHVEIDNACDEWDYKDAAAYLLTRLVQLRKIYGRVCLLSGGEVSVPLPPVHGKGGRNQQFALECALRLSEAHVPATVLSAGTDGVDGNSPAAGAVIDEQTVGELRAAGLNPKESLLRFDTYTALNKPETVILTGPTRNNLRDIRILLAD